MTLIMFWMHIHANFCACETETQCYTDIYNHPTEKDKEVDDGHSAAVSQTAHSYWWKHVDLQRCTIKATGRKIRENVLSLVEKILSQDNLITWAVLHASPCAYFYIEDSPKQDNIHLVLCLKSNGQSALLSSQPYTCTQRLKNNK